MFYPQLSSTVCCFLSASALAIAAAVSQAQLSLPNTPLPAPEQVTVAPSLPLNPALPTLFIVGDSTARNQADLGWGDHLAAHFDTARLNVANRAIAGRSTRTYIKEGAWDKVLAQIKPGDYVLLQLGHNDGGNLDGAKPRGTLKGLGNETKDVTLPDGSVETVHSYGWYLSKFIADTRSHHATPVLLSLTVRNIWTIGPEGKPHIERDMGYDGLLRQISAVQQVNFVDMSNEEADRLEEMGPAKAALLFPKDHTHTSAEGAELNASSVIQALRNAHSPLVMYLSSTITTPVLVQADAVPRREP